MTVMSPLIKLTYQMFLFHLYLKYNTGFTFNVSNIPPNLQMSLIYKCLYQNKIVPPHSLMCIPYLRFIEFRRCSILTACQSCFYAGI